MHLWQLDLVGGVFLADGRECTMLTGIDDHSRFVVVAAVLAVPSGRAVADAFLKAMRVYGVPSEVLTDNGKQFTGRFTKPRPAEVLFERVCRENGITARLTKPHSPTTTGKIERWHQTLRRELLDLAEPFVDLPSAQAAISAWVHTYNYDRPHQSLDMATPASLFRPNAQPEPLVLTAPQGALGEQYAADAIPGQPSRQMPGRRQRAGAAAVGRCGRVRYRHRRQRAAGGHPFGSADQLGPRPGGQRAHVWVDEYTVHILIDGQLIKTVPSNLSAEDLRALSMRGARPAGPPPATASVARAGRLPAATVIEVDRIVDINGNAEVAEHRLRLGPSSPDAKSRCASTAPHARRLQQCARQDAALADPVDQYTKMRGAGSPPVNHRPQQPADQRATQGSQRRRRHGRPPTPTVGRTYCRQDRHHPRRGHPLRVTCDGAQLSIHPRTT